MLQYMLDTDICSYAMKQTNDSVRKRMERTPVEVMCISAVNKAELLFGIALSPRPEQDSRVMGTFLQYMRVLDFPEAAALHYAEIRAALKRSGQMIGANDLFIAAHARSLGLTLVTNNVREFGRVAGLIVENWADGQ